MNFFNYSVAYGLQKRHSSKWRADVSFAVISVYSMRFINFSVSIFVTDLQSNIVHTPCISIVSDPRSYPVLV